MTATDEMSIGATGRAWVFGDDINTDDMYPGFAMRLPTAEAATHMFNASRPGWAGQVSPGDFLIAGRNFGLGSSRPVPLLFKELGIAGLIAEQFNSLFYRNCINYGLTAVVMPDARDKISEGDLIAIDPTASLVVNASKQTTSEHLPLPEFLRLIVDAGGLLARLENEGYLSERVPE